MVDDLDKSNDRKLTSSALANQAFGDLVRLNSDLKEANVNTISEDVKISEFKI